MNPQGLAAAASIAMVGRARVAAGAAALVAAAQYFVAEALAAAAWAPSGSSYSYSRNYVSDLGRTACAGTLVCSPWAVVMNTGFVLAGVLAIAAATLLAPLIRARALRWTVVTLAVIHGCGSIVVGFAHSGAAPAAGLPSLHLLGAYAAVVGGNTALLAVSFALRRPTARVATAALSVVGLFCGLALTTLRSASPGLLERGAVDTITVWEVATGLVLLDALRRRTDLYGACGDRRAMHVRVIRTALARGELIGIEDAFRALIAYERDVEGATNFDELSELLRVLCVALRYDDAVMPDGFIGVLRDVTGRSLRGLTYAEGARIVHQAPDQWRKSLQRHLSISRRRGSGKALGNFPGCHLKEPS